MDNLSNKVIECTHSRVFIREDGILQIEIQDNTYFEVKDAHELVAAAEELGGGKRFLNLIFTGKDTLLDTKARVLSSSKEGSRLKLADAFVINTIAQKLIANFIVKAQNPAVPTSFFRDEESAVKWLKNL